MSELERKGPIRSDRGRHCHGGGDQDLTIAATSSQPMAWTIRARQPARALAGGHWRQRASQARDGHGIGGGELPAAREAASQLAAAAGKYGIPLAGASAQRMADYFEARRNAVLTYNK